MTDGTLDWLDEDWDTGLAVVAHPDDMEYGTAAAVARWTKQGKSVAYVLATRGEAGIGSMSPDEVVPVRAAEQEASCAAVGVSTLEYLDHPDGLVVADLALRRDLAAAIRRHRPDVVLSINFRDSWGGPSWNHVDHRNLGVALLDAVRDAANPWIFTDLPDPAWAGVRFVAFGSSPAATHAVDVTDTMDDGVASLMCHRAYLENLEGDPADAAQNLRSAAASAGERVAVDYAVTFEVLTP